MQSKEQIQEKQRKFLKALKPKVATTLSDPEALESHHDIEFFDKQRISIPLQDNQGMTSFSSIS